VSHHNEFSNTGRFFEKSLNKTNLSWWLTACLAIGACGTAQAQSDPDTPPTQLPAAPPSPAPTADTLKFKELDTLVLKGWATKVPTFEDTVDGDAGGWRSALASAGFGFTAWSLNLGVYDMAQAGRGQTGAQLYNGQKFTYQTGNQTAVLTYDVGRIWNGLSGGQWQAIIAGTTNGYQARDGLKGVRVKGFSWYQPVAHGKAELELGIIANQTDYMGTSVGGSLAGGALGPQASIPVEAGMSYGQYGAPTFSARINWTDQLYTRSAIQRSMNPKGSTAEETLNPAGFAFTMPGAKPLFIQEIGYRVVAAPGVKSLWLRAGGLYNTSDYQTLVGGQLRHNYFVYAAADRQLTQPDSAQPGRGLYVGATFNAAPGNVDLIDRYYEARTYMRGPIAGRPDDMVSLVAAISGYGVDGREANTVGVYTPRSTTQSYTGSYSFKITHGLYIQPGVSVLVHPVYNRDIGTAVNGLLNLVVFL
jgi:porin